MNRLIVEITKDLKENLDPRYKKGVEQYFKEEVRFLGVRTPIVRSIAQKYFDKSLKKQQLLDLCEELFNQPYNEFATIAFAWTFKIRKSFELSDFERFERWIDKYVNNWAKCDDFCCHTIYYFVENFPEIIPRIKKWAYSKNMWFRRASAVSFVPAKNNLSDIFEIAKILLRDEDDLVQKGYGWMLKSASVFNQEAVFSFVMKNKKDMPRTALRYAIEHMPKDFKEKAMRT